MQSTSKQKDIRPKVGRLSGILAAFAFFSFAFLTPSPSGVPGIQAAVAEEDPFVLQFPKLTLKSGAEAPAPVTLKPKAGWKWNTEYPASAEVSVDGPCETTTKTLGKSGKAIELKGKDVVFPVSLKGNAAGSAKVTVMGNFSICNEESCKIFRKRSMVYTVEIK